MAKQLDYTSAFFILSANLFVSYDLKEFAAGLH